MNILNSKLRKLSLLFIGLISLFFISSIENVNATVSNDDAEKDKTKNDNDMMNLKIKISLNNIDPTTHKIKIISFVNGEVKEQFVDLLQDKSKARNNILVLKLQFAKNNEVSSIVPSDQYFVCGYAVNDNIKNKTAISNNEISLYDCDEGNIGNPDSATAHLFSTLNKFTESTNYNKIKGNKDPLAKEVKINVKVPLEDAIDDVDQINVIGMVRGEYKLETINAKEALEKQEDNNEGILDVPFIFNRVTKAGIIQSGDKFFGCVAGEELSPQHTHCEKRTIKDFGQGNVLYSRKDNNFK
jgi:hypothetical protein